ncbi:hypothetical protein RQP46_005996 [Phenoliferia psychrophenolica]
MLASSLSLLVASALVRLSSAANQQVIVGGTAGLVFTPSSITAAVGDTVTFIYQSKNHTVTQSSFAAPCTLLTNATSGATGFDSSYVPVAANATENPAWTLEVLATTESGFFCKQSTHCSMGMVGAINAPATGNKTFDAYLALAKTQQQTTEAAGGTSVVSSGVGAVATGSLSSVAASSATTAAKTAGSETIKRSGMALLACAVVAITVL